MSCSRGISAAGSAQHWQCWGQRFESAMLHKAKISELDKGSDIFVLGAVLIPPHLVHFVEIDILLFLAARYVMWGKRSILSQPSADSSLCGGSL